MCAPPIDEQRIELKYPLDASLADQVRAWAREHLSPDTHCEPGSGDHYPVHTLYLDNDQWDLYRSSSAVDRSKQRVRRYGSSEQVWLETKSKSKDAVVTKQRFPLMLTDWQTQCQRLPQPWTVAGAEWFFDRILTQSLQPKVQVHYRRFARMLQTDHQTMRLTIDSQLEASLPSLDGSIGDTATANKRSLGSIEILELKFNGVLPDLFKSLLTTFPLRAAGFSKYRNSIDAFDLVNQRQQLLSLESNTARPKPSIALAPAS